MEAPCCAKRKADSRLEDGQIHQGQTQQVDNGTFHAWSAAGHQHPLTGIIVIEAQRPHLRPLFAPQSPATGMPQSQNWASSRNADCEHDSRHRGKSCRCQTVARTDNSDAGTITITKKDTRLPYECCENKRTSTQEDTSNIKDLCGKDKYEMGQKYAPKRDDEREERPCEEETHSGETSGPPPVDAGHFDEPELGIRRTSRSTPTPKMPRASF